MTSLEEVSDMNGFLGLVQELVNIDINREPTPETPIELREAWEKVEAAGKKDPKGVWDVLRNGTEDEFAALCNIINWIGGEFDNSDSLLEIMRIARKRLENPQNYQYLMDGIQGCFCSDELFDKYWNATEPGAETPEVI